MVPNARKLSVKVGQFVSLNDGFQPSTFHRLLQLVSIRLWSVTSLAPPSTPHLLPPPLNYLQVSPHISMNTILQNALKRFVIMCYVVLMHNG